MYESVLIQVRSRSNSSSHCKASCARCKALLRAAHYQVCQGNNVPKMPIDIKKMFSIFSPFLNFLLTQIHYKQQYRANDTA